MAQWIETSPDAKGVAQSEEIKTSGVKSSPA